MKKEDMKFKGLDISIVEVQREQLNILLQFDRVCKGHDIKYQLFAGTLLGAIRHNGFIPWDDDIDVCMLREEYDKFLRVRSELGEEFFVQNYNSDKQFHAQYSKIRKNNTRFVEKIVQDVDMHHGIFIDIFPCDNIKPGTRIGEMQRFILEKMTNMSTCRIKRLNEQCEDKVKRTARKSVYYALKLVPKIWVDKFITKVMIMFNDENVEYVGDLTLSTSKKEFKKFTIKRESLKNSIDWCFEGHLFPVSEDYDSILTNGYGDYMSYPPLEDQEPHHGIIEIDFDKGDIKHE